MAHFRPVLSLSIIWLLSFFLNAEAAGKKKREVRFSVTDFENDVENLIRIQVGSHYTWMIGSGLGLLVAGRSLSSRWKWDGKVDFILIICFGVVDVVSSHL